MTTYYQPQIIPIGGRTDVATEFDLTITISTSYSSHWTSKPVRMKAKTWAEARVEAREETRKLRDALNPYPEVELE